MTSGFTPSRSTRMSEHFTVEGSGALYIMVLRSYSGNGYWKCWVLSGEPSARNGRENTYFINSVGIDYAFNSGPDSSSFDLYSR